VSGDLVPRPSFAVRAVDRQHGRRLDQIRRSGEVELLKIQVAGRLTDAGLMEVASFTALETNLIKQVPLAEPRLAMVGDSGAVAIAAIIQRVRNL